MGNLIKDNYCFEEGIPQNAIRVLTGEPIYGGALDKRLFVEFEYPEGFTKSNTHILSVNIIDDIYGTASMVIYGTKQSSAYGYNVYADNKNIIAECDLSSGEFNIIPTINHRIEIIIMKRDM